MEQNAILVEAYKHIHKKDPDKELKDHEIAKKLIEVFGNRNHLSVEMETECERVIRYVVLCPSLETKKEILRDMENFQTNAKNTVAC